MTRAGRRQARAMSYRWSWAMGATVHLLSHKNGPVGLLEVGEKVKVRMVWTANDLVLTLEADVFRQEACAEIEMIL